MKAPFIFMNEESEYFYIFPNVFFSKSKDGTLSKIIFAPCECFDKKRISKEGVQIQIRRKDKCCLNRLSNS